MAKKAAVAKTPKQPKATKTPKQPKEKRAKKAKKDKNAPKKNLSPFFCYQKSRRPTLKKEQPNLSHTEIVAVMSNEWKGLNDKDKVPYVKMSEADKVRYEKEKKAYESKKSTEATPASAKKGKKSD